MRKKSITLPFILLGALLYCLLISTVSPAAGNFVPLAQLTQDSQTQYSFKKNCNNLQAHLQDSYVGVQIIKAGGSDNDIKTYSGAIFPLPYANGLNTPKHLYSNISNGIFHISFKSTDIIFPFHSFW